MKITVTGSLGHISKPLAQTLVQKGHTVTVISSKEERRKDIEAIGAEAAIGTMEDADFLASTFKGADVVYLMETLGQHNGFFEPNLNIVDALTKIGNNYKKAIETSGVKRVIHLSSIGAHTNKGNGLLAFHYNIEEILKELPDDVAIKFMRPVGFYYNMFAYLPTIKSQGLIIQNYGGDEKEPWVSTIDIADVVVEEIEKPFGGREIRYIASDEVSPNEVAKILGKAIGKTDLKWQTISDEQMLNGLLNAGMNTSAANGLVQMNEGRRNGVVYADYYKNRPVLGKIKLKDFANEFAAVYDKQ